MPALIEPTKVTAQDGEEDAEDLCEINKWLTIDEHTRNVCQKLNELLSSSGLIDSDSKVLKLAARLHDWGKAHAVFQAKLKPEMLDSAKRNGQLTGTHAAKGPDGKDPNTKQVDEVKNAWRRDKIRRQTADLPDDQKDRRRPGFRHELASALAILETLHRAEPTHKAFAWPDGLDKANFSHGCLEHAATVAADDPLIPELAALNADELDLLVYLVAAHHGKVRMSLRSSPDDDRTNVPDPCPAEKRQARGVRDEDVLPVCQIPADNPNAIGIVTPEVTLSLDLMELGLSPRFGDSWRERMQLLLERLGPFRLAYLEAMLRAADCRASAEEDQAASSAEQE